MISRDSAYSAVLDILNSVDWALAETMGVTKVEPTGKHVNLNFFPGHQGFTGPSFPIGGVMLVANNFDNLSGWESYKIDPTHFDETGTWRKLRQNLIPSTNIPWNDFWFTNYSLGVMDQRNSRYAFPAQVREALRFRECFEKFVSIMKPRLIVTLGEQSSRYLSTDYLLRQREDVRVFGAWRTRLIAAVHTCAWTWQGRGFTAKDFEDEGRRIGLVAAKPLPTASE